MKKILVILFIVCTLGLAAQELDCRVTVNATPTALQTIDKRIFTSLQSQLYEFMNTTQWTTDKFKRDERIKMSILINITKVNLPDEFIGTITVQVQRPIYNTDQNTLLLNFLDENFDFRYQEFQQLLFSENNFLSNLTGVLAYYAYVALALDYDSYSLKGGTQFWQKAQNLVSLAQTTPERGWRANDGFRNRYWLVENILNPVFEPLRETYYKYHRLGLDLMYSNIDNGVAEVNNCLELLNKVNKARPASFNLQLFFNAKTDELIGIFTGALPADKTKAVNLLNQMDPTNQNKYNKILAN